MPDVWTLQSLYLFLFSSMLWNLTKLNNIFIVSFTYIYIHLKDLSNLIYNKDSILYLACPASNLGALFKSTVKRMVQTSLNVMSRVPAIN